MYNLAAIFVSGTYMVTTHEVDVAVGSVMTCVHQCLVNMPIQNKGNVSYVWNVEP